MIHVSLHFRSELAFNVQADGWTERYDIDTLGIKLEHSKVWGPI